MASIPVNQLESFDSGSNYNFVNEMLDPLNARAAFDLSYRTLGTTAEDGVLQTIALIDTLPGDTITINFSELLRSLPTVVPLESRKRQYIYAFWGRMGDYWNDWNTFAKKGYDGNYNIKTPVIKYGANVKGIGPSTPGTVGERIIQRETGYNTTWENREAIQATSMGENMGLPHNYTQETHGTPAITLYANRSDFRKFVYGQGYAHEITAIPFMQKLRIWRDYFVNKDYFINDRVILPHDDAEFRLDTDGKLISAKNNGSQIIFDFWTKTRDLEIFQETGTGDATKYYFFGEPYHEFPKDRFTSAKPFLQRGTAPTLDYTINSDIIKVHPGTGSGSAALLADGIELVKAPNAQNATWNPYNQSTDYTYSGVKLSNTNIKLDIKMADLRKLAIEQTELEKMARTDGSYAEFGLTFFGKVSKNAYDFKPIYIGGTYKEIVYSEVVQTSESGSTPMGSYAGHSTSSHGDQIGTIDCDDFGYIQIISCIMPDVIYSEGLADHWDRLYQKDLYLPERAKIGMTALLNKRCYFDYDVTAAAETYNEGLFAYQNYGDCYRYHENEVHGAMAEGFNTQFMAYTQSRILAGQMNWGRSFALASKNNIRMDYLAAPSLPSFTYDIHLGIRAVRKIPYKPIPANLTGL